jgi:hypothetical protein
VEQRSKESGLTDDFGVGLTLRSFAALPAAQDDSGFYFDDVLGGATWDGLGSWGGESLDL